MAKDGILNFLGRTHTFINVSHKTRHTCSYVPVQSGASLRYVFHTHFVAPQLANCLSAEWKLDDAYSVSYVQYVANIPETRLGHEVGHNSSSFRGWDECTATCTRVKIFLPNQMQSFGPFVSRWRCPSAFAGMDLYAACCHPTVSKISLCMYVRWSLEPRLNRAAPDVIWPLLILSEQSKQCQIVISECDSVDGYQRYRRRPSDSCLTFAASRRKPMSVKRKKQQVDI